MDRLKRYLRTNLEFLVLWQGYDETHDSYEPYTEMKRRESFKQYCLQNDLRYYRYIPHPETLHYIYMVN